MASQLTGQHGRDAFVGLPPSRDGLLCIVPAENVAGFERPAHRLLGSFRHRGVILQERDHVDEGRGSFVDGLGQFGGSRESHHPPLGELVAHPVQSPARQLEGQMVRRLRFHQAGCGQHDFAVAFDVPGNAEVAGFRQIPIHSELIPIRFRIWQPTVCAAPRDAFHTRQVGGRQRRWLHLLAIDNVKAEAAHTG